jgi:hypothetical protein
MFQRDRRSRAPPESGNWPGRLRPNRAAGRASDLAADSLDARWAAFLRGCVKTRPPILERGNRSTHEFRTERNQVFYWRKSWVAPKSRVPGETNSLRPLQSDVFTQPPPNPDIPPSFRAGLRARTPLQAGQRRRWKQRAKWRILPPINRETGRTKCDSTTR